MARRKMTHKLINREDISEELYLIPGSETDYLTKTGKVYKDYGDNKFFPKKLYQNWGYWYCGITYPDGNKNRRIHRLLAEMFIPNPNNYPIVLHLDSDKANMSLDNLKWGTVSENTLQAYEEGMAHNDKSWDDSQSIPVCCFDLEGNLLNKYGSVSEASRERGLTKTAILNQCNHNVKTKPRKGYWFRYLSEYEQKGFVL